MKNVLHIGAAEGELEYYIGLGVNRLVYVEPDKDCLHKLTANVREKLSSFDNLTVAIVPMACSSESGKTINFYANGTGQSSIEEPQFYTKSIVGDNFNQYNVHTVSLIDLKFEFFGTQIVDYLCIDTQGHEKKVLCAANTEFLSQNFRIIDVELMTDISQYSVDTNSWREVVLHLLAAGFQPIIHPHGITESYIFINPLLMNNILDHLHICSSRIRDELVLNYLDQAGLVLDNCDIPCLAALGDYAFLPFSHINGSIHMSLLQPFRERFVKDYFSLLSLL